MKIRVICISATVDENDKDKVWYLFNEAGEKKEFSKMFPFLWPGKKGQWVPGDEFTFVGEMSN